MSMLLRRPVIAIAAASFTTLAAYCGVANGAEIHHSWEDSALSRIEALAVLQSLNAELLSNASATLTLDRWCSAHNLAPAGSKIIAQRVRDEDKPADGNVRKLLSAKPGEAISYRRVRLRCGDRVLSEADNWYLPSKLTPEMNEVLNTSDVAFGRAVQALNFSRTNLSADLLWMPMPRNWEMQPLPDAKEKSLLVVPPFVLQHHAVLKLPDGSPFSALVETYTSNVLDFPMPATR